MRLRAHLLATTGGIVLMSAAAGAQAPACAASQSRYEAWWTGPMLANSAATLPRGHILLEPYFYDVAVRSSYDHNRVRHNVAPSHGYGSLTYAIYGLTDDIGIGLIPVVGFNTVSGGPNSSRVGVGDIGMLAQYRLVRARPCRWMPDISVAIQETFPTGKYDNLGARASDGLGGGAYFTTVSLYSQKSVSLRNGHTFRTRFNVSQSFSRAVNVEGVSVYGTGADFRGRAEPGRSASIDASLEYSVRRSVALALDVTYRGAHNTHVAGYGSSDLLGTQNIAFNSGPSEAVGLAPAIEYSWTSNVGVLLGARFIPAGRNTSASITPAVAINFVR
ncbi:MAG: transporter [bacterium]